MEKRKNPILVTRPGLPDITAYTSRIQVVWEDHWLTNGGPLVQELETRLRAQLGVENVVVYSNGHLALDCALRSLGICGEVITSPFTFLSTVNAIAMNGLTPVFCDIKEQDCTLDENKLERLITKRTCAILPIHVYGFPCNHETIQTIASRYGLKVIYDAAHAFGVSVNGRGIGTFGDLSMFSFHATKVFHTVEGGAITFNDGSLRGELMSRKNFGLKIQEQCEAPGLNAKMTEFHAAMGLCNLELFPQQVEKRKAVVERYLAKLEGVPDIHLFSWSGKDVTYNYAYFPVLSQKRDLLLQRLAEDYNIFGRKYFYPAVNELACYRGAEGETPIARRVAQQAFCLPLYADLSFEDIDYICDATREIMTEG